MRILNSTTFITVLAYAFSGLAMAYDNARPEEKGLQPKIKCEVCRNEMDCSGVVFNVCMSCVRKERENGEKNKVAN